MPILTETPHAGGFLVWEALRDYCRSTVILASGNLQPGTILGKITASGKYAAHDPAASNGTQTAAAILWNSVDASGGDTNAVVLIRGPAIVNPVSYTHLDVYKRQDQGQPAAGLCRQVRTGAGRNRPVDGGGNLA